MKLNIKNGSTIAAAAFSLALTGLATTPAIAAEGEAVANIHCEGVNTCKGSSDCKTADNECAGLNSCKGHGFVALTAEQCEKVGGTVG